MLGGKNKKLVNTKSKQSHQAAGRHGGENSGEHRNKHGSEGRGQTVKRSSREAKALQNVGEPAVGTLNRARRL